MPWMVYRIEGKPWKQGRVCLRSGGKNPGHLRRAVMLLSRIAAKVIVVHRRDTLRATKVYHEPLMQAENVEFRWNSVATEFLHWDKLTGVRLRGVISVGRKPAAELFSGRVKLDQGGYIAADEDTVVAIPGVCAVVDVRAKLMRQVVTAVADGAVAVYMAEEFLAGLK